MTANSAASPSKTPGFLQRHHFLLRRLHSLSGILPVGIFVIFHLFTNSQLALGDFQHEVDWIHALPALFLTEIGLWVAIGFHATLGLVYTFAGARPNASRYTYWDNWRYTLQRVSGIIALIYIFLHVYTLRWRLPLFGWYTPFDPEHATATTAYALQYAWWVPVLYLVGGLTVVYHWSNGLWTAAITWGLTISEKAMKRWGYVCAVMGLALTVFLVSAVVGAMTHQFTKQQQATIEKVQQRGVPTEHKAGE